MTALFKGLVVAAVHAIIVAGIGAKFLYDRSHDPRLWVKTAPFDPELPIRGRYVSIGLHVDADRSAGQDDEYRDPVMFRARLEVRGDRLVAVEDRASGRHWVTTCRRETPDCWQLADNLAYFIPENATDPSRPREDATLWAEVTVPPKGAPRPIRLGLMKDGALEPLDP